MAVRNLKDGSKKPWQCELYPNGRNGNRIRKRFATKGEATAYELFTMKEVDDKPWLGDKHDSRRLIDIVDKWYTLYGISLINGSNIYSKMQLMAKAMGNPLAIKLSGKMYAEFRQERLAGNINFVAAKWKRGKASIATCNSELARFKAVFSKMRELGEWAYPNPLEDIKPLKEKEREMSFLSNAQLTALLDLVSRHTITDMLCIVKLCLSTGARWNEVALMRGSQLSKYKVTFTNTKNGKNRSVPISKELYDEVYKPTSGKLFEQCYTPFCYILKTKLDLDLPSGQASHVLRHTFASHFMMNGGNILVLRDILGHADIAMTMRYAHFAPEHLSEAITKNPLQQLSESKP
ncbi:phage integrase [Photobacterium sanguinicancri]|uniref:phage integrase n=1 Tax=Photobacterium sanguinicancri TaxID=875932 RepID=UPI00248120CA|nr:tyrosine-type recombinase/integrase [Photobacterium sanguinicancri]